MLHRVSRVIAAVVLLAASLGSDAFNPQVARAAMPACAGDTFSHFLGNARGGSGLKGVYGEIEHMGQSLCTQGATKKPSWVLSWVSIEGPQNFVDGYDIYQAGYARCPAPIPTGPGSCPWNNGAAYFFAWYGREGGGACGAKFESGFVNLGSSPTSGYHFFQVSKVGNFYNVYVDESLKTARYAWEIDTCWPGVTRLEWQNETLDKNDQGGGRVANPKGFVNNQFQNANGWNNANRALSSACDANSNIANWHCVNSANVQRNFSAWDDRVP